MYYKNEELLLGVLPEDPDKALSVGQIRKYMKSKGLAFWFTEKTSGSTANNPKAHKVRKEQKDATAHQTVYRFLRELQNQGKVDLGETGAGGKRYFKKSKVSDQDLVNEHKALKVLFSSQLLSDALVESSVNKDQNIGVKKIAKQALKMAGESINGFLEAIQVIPDGISRLPVVIDKKTISEIVKAITEKKQVEIKYLKKNDRNRFREDVSPISLVIKDGAHYLIAASGKVHAENLISYALQRLESVKCIPTPSDMPNDNETRQRISAVIKEHFQFGHPVEVSKFPLKPSSEPVEIRSARQEIIKPELIELRLRVAPRAEFHFTERPLSEEQTFSFAPGFTKDLTDGNPQSWKVLVVTLPYTVMLLPFILSYGPWVFVESPEVIRRQLREVTEDMLKLYPPENSNA